MSLVSPSYPKNKWTRKPHWVYGTLQGKSTVQVHLPLLLPLEPRFLILFWGSKCAWFLSIHTGTLGCRANFVMNTDMRANVKPHTHKSEGLKEVLEHCSLKPLHGQNLIESCRDSGFFPRKFRWETSKSQTNGYGQPSLTNSTTLQLLLTKSMSQ